MTILIPKMLYHGTVTSNIAEFEPRNRFTPGGRADTPARVYASDDPVFAAMHSFPWSSDEGIDILERDGRLRLLVPKQLEARLDQPVYLYELPSDTFALTEEEETGSTYHSEVSVIPASVQAITSVREAVHHFGGHIQID